MNAATVAALLASRIPILAYESDSMTASECWGIIGDAIEDAGGRGELAAIARDMRVASAVFFSRLNAPLIQWVDGEWTPVSGYVVYSCSVGSPVRRGVLTGEMNAKELRHRADVATHLIANTDFYYRARLRVQWDDLPYPEYCYFGELVADPMGA